MHPIQDLIEADKNVSQSWLVSAVPHIARLCMELKQHGHDAFFDWSPHVMKFAVYVYVDGWEAAEARHAEAQLTDPEAEMDGPDYRADCYLDPSREDVEKKIRDITAKLISFKK